MSWARVDDGLHDHPKFVGIPLAAVGLWTLCLSYAGKRRDPTIPQGLPRRFGALPTHAASLVDVGLWDATPSGWVIHNWISYSEKPSTERTRRFRERRGNGSETRSPGSPVPVPVPVPESIEVPNGTSHWQSRDGVAARVFEAWQGATGHQRARLTPGRSRLVATRMREGFSEQDLTDAVLGVTLDPWQDRKLHDGFEVILRDAAHVEKFRDLWRNPPQAVAKPVPRNPIVERISQSFRSVGVLA